MRKTGKRIGIALCIYLVFLIVGMLVPFINMKPVSEEYQQSIDVNRFRRQEEGNGNERAAVIEENQEALDIRLSMIEEARDRIVMSTFDIRMGNSTDDIFSALLHAADRGVEVKILVDGMYGLLHMNSEPVFYAAGSHENVEIKFYNIPNPLTPWNIHGRMHDKYLMIDETMLLMGGRNTFDYFLGNYDSDAIGLDREVFVYSVKEQPAEEMSAVIQVQHYFDAMWEDPVCRLVYEKVPDRKREAAEAERERLKERFDELNVLEYDFKKRTVPIKQAVLISNPTHIYGKEPYVFAQLKALMETAEEEVVIHTPYAVFSDEMYEGMAEVNKKAGKVEMILNSVASGDNICASSDYSRNRQKIFDTGITVYEYMGQHSTHGKSIAIDRDISVIGSYNLDNRSTYVDTELMLVIQSEELNAQLRKHLEALKDNALVIENHTGEYLPDSQVKERQIGGFKKLLIEGLSFVMQGFRYLV